ncbi:MULTISPECIES: prenyltransferase/squalene oxidase repeat-containing protein [Paenibacillus]|uniref:terpene cyclase/mutase family protein n=1 Tax=Paenibacillus TaxID=44249 RepID=UPI0011638278|nr:prenyltransferase/squalene oxidase repeat-containing protein [Paenibacillus sp. Cedars]AWP28285.1 squalene--hopene cyclase [Paenibacillus sp. Cedars]
MNDVQSAVEEEISKLIDFFIQRQHQDGSWHFCFENGITLDAYVIILFRILEIQNEELIRELHDRILAEQQPEGCWRWYHDEEGGSLSATIDAYYGLLYSGFSKWSDEHMEHTRRYIQSQGGLGKSKSVLTKAILAATGQRKWPASISLIPLEIILFPAYLPINLYEFSGYSRIHLIPMLIMADRNFSISTETAPDLSDLNDSRDDDDDSLPQENREIGESIRMGLSRLLGTPRFIHEAASTKGEKFMLDRIESDGTLYSYASSTILMVFALLALGYDKRHPILMNAVQGLTALQYRVDGKVTIQNSPSTIWDTALILYALQESGVDGDQQTTQRAAAYLLSRQQDKTADWSIHNRDTVPGGWGFSETNTLNPDVDDTTAALRAIHSLSHTTPIYQHSTNRGLNWVLSMQNKDGGWPAFEKNTDKEMLTWLAIDGAKSAAIDPSGADLTGRTLEYLGNFCGFGMKHDFIKRGTEWLITHQEKNGSWYGRWGICYIYGTWAALTGLEAAGLPADHSAIQRGAAWLLEIQNPDGGWGESCTSDQVMQYMPLGQSTASQTAWALDALIAVQSEPSTGVNRGINRLIELLHEDDWTASYPMGAGLPGSFYTHYHSYRYIWPLLTLSHYKKKYGVMRGLAATLPQPW